jgi:hypothetical protein
VDERSGRHGSGARARQCRNRSQRRARSRKNSGVWR